LLSAWAWGLEGREPPQDSRRGGWFL